MNEQLAMLCPHCMARHVAGPELELWFLSDGRVLVKAGRQSFRDPTWIEMTASAATWLSRQIEEHGR